MKWDLIDQSILGGLFGIKKEKESELIQIINPTFGEKKLDLDKNKYFGVFVSIKRNKKFHKSKNYDIHGCMGDINDDFKMVSDFETIINFTNNAAYNATFKDRRHLDFSFPIYIDMTTYYEFIPLQGPLLKMVDIENGIFVNDNGENTIFNNKYYGVYGNIEGNIATFLPKVFNENWSFIRKKLIEKATGNGNKSPSIEEYNVYKGPSAGKTLYEFFTSHFVNYMNRTFLNSNFHGVFIPYEMSKQGATSIKQDSHVRNVATLKDILSIDKYLKKFIKDKAKDADTVKPTLISDEVMKNIIYHVELYLDMYNIYMKNNGSLKEYSSLRQSLPFLIMCMHYINKEKYHNNIKNIVNELLKVIELLDPNFELGEVLTGIANVYSIIDDKNDRNRIINLLKTMFHINNLSFKEDYEFIFRINWYSQGFIAYVKNGIVPQEITMLYKNLSDVLIKHANILDNDSETERIVVTFEALCALYPIHKHGSDKIYELMKLLTLRMNSNGLITFKDGNARVDMTGHFLNGINHLMEFSTNDQLRTSLEYFHNKGAYIQLLN